MIFLSTVILATCPNSNSDCGRRSNNSSRPSLIIRIKESYDTIEESDLLDRNRKIFSRENVQDLKQGDLFKNE